MKLPNINTRQTSSTDWNIMKQQRHVLEFVFEWKWKKGMKRTRNLCGWSSWKCARHLKDDWLQDECWCRHLRDQEFTQDKTRREEDTSLSQFTHKFGRDSILTKSILLFQRPKPSFYREEDRSQVQGKLTREALKGDLITLPILAPKGEWRGTFLDLS